MCTYGVNVGVRVLGLAVLGEDARRDLVDLADQLEHWVVRQVLLGELALGDVSGVRLPQHGVAVTGHDLALLERRPEVVLDGLVAEVVADLPLHVLQPPQHLLVGQTVERSGKTVETSREREHGRAQSTADEVGRVRADVATLVVGVDGEVQAHELDEVAVLGEAKLVGEVVAVVLVLLDWRNLAILVDVAVDLSGDRWELGDQVHRVLEGMLPVL